MYPTFLKEAQVIRQVLTDLPSVVITMPFEPRLRSRNVLERYAMKIFSKAKTSLRSDPFSGDPAPVISRLNKQLNTLDYHSSKKSISLFVTRSMDKIFYVDMPLEETISVNGSFYMRDLVHHKLKTNNYLVLVVNKCWANTYTGCDNYLRLVKADSPAHLFDYSTGRTPANKKRNVYTGKSNNDFLKMIATQFNWMTSAFPCPVFIIGNKNDVTTVFQHIHDRKNIVQLIHRDTDTIDTTRINRCLKPFLQDWDTVWQTWLMQQIEQARNNDKLVTGLSQVACALRESAPGLLLIDENMYIPFKHDQSEEGSSEPFYINDRIDKLIERAIHNGTEIEFVKPELLQEDYGIAMIQPSAANRIPDVREEKAQSWNEIF